MAKNQKSFEEEILAEPHFIQKYGKQFVIGIVAILVIVFGFMGYKNLIVEPREASANDAIATAQKSLTQIASGQQDSTTLAALQKAAQTVADEYGSTDAGNLAHLYAGIALYNQGKYQEALNEFKDFSDCGDQAVSATVYAAIGDCQACLGQHADAAKSFEKAADKSGSENLAVMQLIKAGEMYEFGVKDNAKALEVYNKANSYKAAYQVQQGQIDAYIERVSNK